MVKIEVGKLHKKLKRLERQYSKMPKGAKIRKMRIAKTYSATVRKIEKLTGMESI